MKRNDNQVFSLKSKLKHRYHTCVEPAPATESKVKVWSRIEIELDEIFWAIRLPSSSSSLLRGLNRSITWDPNQIASEQIQKKRKTRPKGSKRNITWTPESQGDAAGDPFSGRVSKLSFLLRGTEGSGGRGGRGLRIFMEGDLPGLGGERKREDSGGMELGSTFSFGTLGGLCLWDGGVRVSEGETLPLLGWTRAFIGAEISRNPRNGEEREKQRAERAVARLREGGQYLKWGAEATSIFIYFILAGNIFYN